MTQKNEVYRCKVCTNIVEMLQAGVGQLVCCEQPMELFKENTVDASHEKHVPVIEKTTDGVKVTVGSIDHPMLNEHYIEWIEIITDEKIYRKFLYPGEEPEATFNVQDDNIEARAYCNLHGLWRK